MSTEVKFEIPEIDRLRNTTRWLWTQVQSLGITKLPNGKPVPNISVLTEGTMRGGWPFQKKIDTITALQDLLIAHDEDKYFNAVQSTYPIIAKSAARANVMIALSPVEKRTRREARKTKTKLNTPKPHPGEMKLDNIVPKDIMMFTTPTSLPKVETMGQSTETVDEAVPDIGSDLQNVNQADGDTGLLEEEGDEIVEVEFGENINRDEEERKTQRAELEQKADEDNDEQLRTTLEQRFTDFSETKEPTETTKETKEPEGKRAGQPEEGSSDLIDMLLSKNLDEIAESTLDELISHGREVGSDLLSQAGDAIDQRIEQELGISAGVGRAIRDLIAGGTASGVMRSLEDISDMDPELAQSLGKFINQVTGVVRIKKQPAGIDTSRSFGNNVSLIQQAVAGWKFDTNIFNSEFS